jgi:hypothetical protein
VSARPGVSTPTTTSATVLPPTPSIGGTTPTQVANPTNCPYGQTAAAGVCFAAPTILPRNISILNDDTFKLTVTDVDGNVPVVRTPNATGSGYTDQALVGVYGINPDAVKVTDATGAVFPAVVVVGQGEVGRLEQALKVTLKSNKIEYGKTYTFSLDRVVGYPNGNPFHTASVAFMTPAASWSIPQTCGPTKSSACRIDNTCTIQNKCRLDPESKYYIPNKKDSSLLYVLSNLGPNPTQYDSFGRYSVYPAHAVSGQFIDKVVPSSGAVFLPVLNTSDARIDYAFFDADGYLYISSSSVSNSASRHCRRIALWSDGGVGDGASIRQSICEVGVPSPWIIPLGKEISLACTKTQRCLVDETSVFFAESPIAYEREVGLGRAITNRSVSCYQGASADVTLMWYYRSIGPDVCDNGKFGFGGGLTPSYQGGANSLGPIRSAFWDGGFLYYELNLPNSCMKFGDGVENVNGEIPVATCPQ